MVKRRAHSKGDAKFLSLEGISEVIPPYTVHATDRDAETQSNSTQTHTAESGQSLG